VAVVGVEAYRHRLFNHAGSGSSSHSINSCSITRQTIKAISACVRYPATFFTHRPAIPSRSRKQQRFFQNPRRAGEGSAPLL
jgi:hypothetical protein